MVIMPGSEERSRLRGALARGDGADVVQVVTRRPWPVDALQLIGDGLLTAIGLNVDGASPLAAECEGALRARGWVGDEDLAEVLHARLVAAPARLLRRLTIDLGELQGRGRGR
jgi:hypothetical protein